ncbi:hypothetical protein [Halovivax cerinus]|uniref:Cardiolipin synthase N-terminal domain-containing protein n=1 Tax=Halovivax cerinus TaxID=1487865 RepID=A0ABD5NRB4_9EURY|nr:hypothetical protein [Halovivax cerinus]
MVDPLVVFLIAVPVWIQLLLAAFVHYDAGDIGMNARKWAAIVGVIPIAGLAVYLLARSEHFYDPASDPYRERTHEIHPSRRDEPPDPATNGRRAEPARGPNDERDDGPDR